MAASGDQEGGVETNGRNSGGALTSPHEEVLERYKDYPLLLSMLQNEVVRNAKFCHDGRFQMQYPKSNEGWVKCIFIIRGRALDWAIFPMSVAVVHAIVYTLLQQLVFENDQRDLASWDIFFGIVLNSTLAFLLVFRLNRAAGRYWEAREQWGDYVARSRTLTSGILIHAGHCPEHRDHAVRWTAALAMATMTYIHGAVRQPVEIYAGILREHEILQLQSHRHPPLYVTDQVRYHLSKIFAVDIETSVQQANVWAQHLGQLEQQLNVMVYKFGGMERIKNTPLPIVYVSHLRTFLLFALLLLPYVWGPSWGYHTIWLVSVTGFALLGIECAAAEVEQPFRPDRPNALDMNGYCMGLLATLQQQLQSNADREIEMRPC